MNVGDNYTAQDYIIIYGGGAVLYCITLLAVSLLEYINVSSMNYNYL